MFSQYYIAAIPRHEILEWSGNNILLSCRASGKNSAYLLGNLGYMKQVEGV